MSLKHLKQFISEFNPQLESTLQDNMRLFEHKTINEILTQVLPIAKGGKRVRPYLCFLMDSPENQSIHQPIYESLELIHLFALIHDDIMDECDTRRGEATIHAYSRNFYKDQSPEKLSRITESIAILAGDLVFALSEQRFQAALKDITKEKWQLAYQYFDDLKRQVIYGQLLDLHLTSQETATEKEIEDKTFYKTASYTMIKPMQIGCVLAGQEDLLEFCEEFGKPLGLAFQIQDDYLNLTQSEEETGKPQFTDILENQKTDFLQEIQTNPETHQKIKKFIGLESLSKSQITDLNQIFKESGVLEKGKQKFQKLYQESLYVLDKYKSNLPQQSYDSLKELTQYLVSRTN